MSYCVLPIAIGRNLQAADDPRDQESPNILLIIVDDLGFADLSCLGSKDLRTPNIDQLFADSLVLSRLYANCPVCSPTRASVLTGCYPDRVGVPGVIRTHAANSWGYFAPFAQTLPQQLKSLGFETVAIGKWHLGLEPETHPQNQGFDLFQGFLGDMMDDYYDHRRHGVNYMREGQREIDPEGHATDLFTQWASEFIEARQRPSGDREKSRAPWFMYLAYNAPHTPIQPPENWLQKVTRREPGIDPQRAKLVALIEHMDAGIGQVIESLRKSEQYDDTVIIFTSDNGGQLNVGANNGPLRDGKQSMYEGGLRIPGSIRVPGRTTAGSVSDTLCCTADFMPTVSEIVGASKPVGIDGWSLAPLLDSVVGVNHKNLWPDRELYFVRREGGRKYAGLSIEAVLRGKYKLVHNLPSSEIELFNLEVDPAETNNLAKKQPKKFLEMISRLQLHVQRGGQVPWQKMSTAELND
ncbi:MAG: sulfatase-like hydrolase/transferase [Rubripirellula sp.]